jgi:hypothetical protein
VKRVAVFQNPAFLGTAVQMVISEDPADGVLDEARARALAPVILSDYGVPTMPTDQLTVEFYERTVLI